MAGGDTIDFFDKYDRTGKPVAVPSYKRIYLNQNGDVIHEKVNRQNMTSWDLVYYLLRANYDRVDSDYLYDAKLPEERPSDGQISYCYGCTVTDVVDEGSKVRIKFKKALEDGSEAEEAVLADLVIAADGPSSTIRRLFEPSIERKYAGYAVIRGTVPEQEASQAALDVFRERFCFFHGPGIQNLTYTIAGQNGSTKPGERLLNFVWYANFPEGGEELEKVMTDCDGRRRRITIPPGKISPEAWDLLKSKAEGRLPPQMAEMVEKSQAPFVQCITDVISPKNLYMSDKLVFIGDALAGFRPHTVASTSQAAFDVMGLVDWLDGKISRDEYVSQTMRYARLYVWLCMASRSTADEIRIQQRGVYIGDRSQFEDLSIEEYIGDRDMMSTPRRDLQYPGSVEEGLEKI